MAEVLTTAMKLCFHNMQEITSYASIYHLCSQDAARRVVKLNSISYSGRYVGDQNRLLQRQKQYFISERKIAIITCVYIFSLKLNNRTARFRNFTLGEQSDSKIP